jgi:hypothetical protein
MPGPEPSPPPSLPEYVRDGLQARSPDELEAIAEYASTLADWKRERAGADLKEPPGDAETVLDSDRLEVSEVQDEGGVDVEDASGRSVYLYWIQTQCNKESCSQCPHGPYPYLKYRAGDTVRTKYAGGAVENLGVSPPE